MGLTGISYLDINQLQIKTNKSNNTEEGKNIRNLNLFLIDIIYKIYEFSKILIPLMLIYFS